MEISQRKCVRCSKVLITRHQIKYCSNKCQKTGTYDTSIADWKRGVKTGSVGVQTRIISSSIRRYLFEKYKEKCSICNWGKRNETSGKIPLEVDHIDGNAENNEESNLRLLCPNCHSLTPYFRNLNKGRGRRWRIDRLNNLNLANS